MKAARPLVPLSPVPPTAGRTLDAQLHLMDRQVLDNDGVPVTTVDDLELSGSEAETEIPPGTPPPVLTALLTGPVLGTRIFGGRPPSSRLIRIPWKDVAEVGVVIRLGVNGENLDAGWVERWIRDKIISRIPGGRHDPR
jgi:sporulation protein YlmC with PRC-barrel domain